MLENAAKFIKTPIFLSFCILLKVCVLLSTVDSLRNSKLLVDAGKDILARRSPYSTPNPYGTWPGILYALLDYLSFSTLTLYLIITLNLCGFVLLIKYLVPKSNMLLIIVLSLLTSPVRALVSSVQNTGIIIGALILGIHLLNRFQASNKQIFLHLSAFLFLFAFELKPQLALPLIALVTLQRRIFFLLVSFFFQMVFIRAVLDLWVGEILELEQIRIWKIMRTDELAVKEQISPWKVLGHFIPIGIDWFLVSFILTAVLVLVVALLGLRYQSRKLEVIALAVPLASGYLHYYDLFVLLIFIIASNLRPEKGISTGATFSLTFLALPTHLGSHLIPSEILLIVFINILLAVYVNSDIRSILSRLIESGTALALTSIFSSSFNSLELALSCLLTMVFALQSKTVTNFLWRNWSQFRISA
jgi:hypothetical protein